MLSWRWCRSKIRLVGGRLKRVTLVEPDVYQAHNVERHLFPHSGVGRLKAELAADAREEIGIGLFDPVP